MSEAESTARFSPYVRRVLVALGLATAIVVLLYLVWQVGHAVLAIFAACLVAVFLSGCSSWLSDKTGIAYGKSLGLVVLALVLIAAGLLAVLATRLTQQAQQLYEGMTDTLRESRGWLKHFEWGRQLLDQMENGDILFNRLSPPAMQSLATAVTAVTLALIIVVIGLYLAADPELYKRGVLRLTPLPKRDRIREVLERIGRALRGWLMAQFVSMAVIGSLVAVGLWAFGLELWLLLGVLAGVLTFIPNLGPIIAGIPPILLALQESPWLALGVLVYFTVVQMLEGYFVTPMVQNRVIRLPPAAILSIQLLAGYLFGMLGIIVAAPLLVAIMVAVEMLYVQDVLGDQTIKITGQEHRLLG